MTFDHTIDRTKRIFGSEAGAILGLDPWKTPLQVWLNKTGQASEKMESDAIDLGNALEGAVADVYAKRTGHTLVPSDTILHPTLPIGGTPDRLATDDQSLGLEVKTVWSGRSASKWGEEGTDEVPAHYASQAVLYMALTGRERWDFAALLHGQVRIYTMFRDMDKERRLLDTLMAWWDNHVVKGLPPEPSGSEGDLAWLSKRWSKTSGEMLVATKPVSDIVETYLQSKEMIDSLEGVMASQKSVLQNIIADADGIEGDTFKITWKHRKGSSRVDWQAVAEELAKDRPEILASVVERNTISSGGNRVFLARRVKNHDD